MSWIDWESEKLGSENLICEAKIIQFIFHDQWERLHDYCKKKGIEIVGDMPLILHPNPKLGYRICCMIFGSTHPWLPLFALKVFDSMHTRVENTALVI